MTLVLSDSVSLSVRCTREAGCDEQRFGLRSLGLHSPTSRRAVLQRGRCPRCAASQRRHGDGVVVGTT